MNRRKEGSIAMHGNDVGVIHYRHALVWLFSAMDDEHLCCLINTHSLDLAEIALFTVDVICKCYSFA